MTEKSLVDSFDKNFAEIKERVAAAAEKAGRDPKDIILLGATKTVDVSLINHAISSGLQYIGENRVQELLSKYDGLYDVHKHFIGHLQTNKVKDIINRVELIHSVSSIKLAAEISRQAQKNGKVMDVLIEINIGNEESKSGFSADEALEAVIKIAEMPNLFVKGLMSIPPICEDPEENRKYFRQMNKLFVDIRAQKIDNSSMDILSMGMSDDFEVAISEGANLVRVGTALFGRRNYSV